MSDTPQPNTPSSPRQRRGPYLSRTLIGWILLVLVGVTLVKVSTVGFSMGRPKSMSLAVLYSTWNANFRGEGIGGFEGYTRAKVQETDLYLWTDPKPEGKDLPEGKAQFVVKLPPNALSDETLLAKLSTIPGFEYDNSNQLLLNILLYLGPWVLLFAFFWFFVLRQFRGPGGPGSVLSFGKNRAKLSVRDQQRITFDDVAGIDEAKDEVREVIEFLKNPEKFQRLGGRIPRGIILVGPPGTGKTLLAKAIAGEAEVPFYSICGSDFVEMFVGVGASRVRDLFKQAKESSPCIIFLDEIDAVGRRRGSGLGGGHDEREQTLNAILVEMDGFDTNQQVIVIASTNRPDVLDPALLRPGRFDREITIDLPDVKGRIEILKVHARNVKMSPEADLSRLARATPTFSGADLAAIINEAAIRATLANKDVVEMDDLEESRDKIRWGRQKRSRVMDDHDRRVTAYHEAGHAIVTRLCPEVEPLHKVTIIPRGMSLGATMMLPEKDQYTFTKSRLYGRIKVCLAGQIAERLFFDDFSSGAANDIQQATEIARRMVCEFGMSEKVGPIRYTSREQHVFLGGEIIQPREHSEATAQIIDQEVKKLVDTAHQDSERLIREHMNDMRSLAEALLKYETLTAEEVEKVIAGEVLPRIQAVQPVPDPVPAGTDGNGQIR
jgi:cell division protease FtsH